MAASASLNWQKPASWFNSTPRFLAAQRSVGSNDPAGRSLPESPWRLPPRTAKKLTAVIEALRALKAPCRVELYSDSKYVIDALEKGWARGWKARGWVKSDKKPALNPDLWESLLSLCDMHDVQCHWVKGHAENEYNNRCDQQAVLESQRFK